MKKIRLIGVMVLSAGLAGAASVEERLTALEKGAAAREEVLQKRIGELEEQVATMEAEQRENPLNDIHLGGYGELHYNGLTGSGGAANKREIDFHRFVLTFGKEFSEKIRFFSEVEIEHAMSGKSEGGYVALEQAYLDFDLDDDHAARAGIFLVPVGLLNQTHEPTTFYGVERNSVESQILPTTWFEPGAGLHGVFGDNLNYEVYIHSGLEVLTNSYAVRDGRQKADHAIASDPAGTLALNWVVPGIKVGGSLQYQVDVTQGRAKKPVDALLSEVHADLQKGGWGLRALYAHWELDGAGAEALGADRQLGWYLEPSYKMLESLGVFVRYSQWDNKAGDSGFKTRKEMANAGVSWFPHEQVVVKADYQWQFNEDGKDQDGINLGVGYVF